MNEISLFIEALKSSPGFGEFMHHERADGRSPAYAYLELHPALKSALSKRSIEALYAHQAEAISLIRQDANVVVMTPTASGKSLIYNIPVIESLLKDPKAKALYVYPLKGLAQDQLKGLKDLTTAVSREMTKDEAAPFKNIAGIYDGDTTDYRRRRMRDDPPSVVFTNPDMLHAGINAFHQKWDGFFRDLKYVVIDEAHTYRGVFGSHVAHVIRRLRRIALLYGSDPVFIVCSATISNPTELAGTLCGVPFEAVTKSKAPYAPKNYVFLNATPDVSAYTIATRVFIESVKRGLHTIAFTKARKITELLQRWVAGSAPEIVGLTSSYRAGYLPEERREIESRLFSGELMGVISTSALELGIDIGGLDVCVLVGYPGTISSTLQRSGRVGRSGKESLVVLIALNDALDQHFMRHPEELLKRNVEAAILDPMNRPILKAHLECAISESFLKVADPVYDAAHLRPVLDELSMEGKIRHWVKGNVWYSRKRNPHRGVSIRATGSPYLICTDSGALLGESSSSRVLRELHPGAIYLHRGVQYRIVRLDMEARRITCVADDEAPYYTRAISNEETIILSESGAMALDDDTTVHIGALRVTEQVSGYVKKEAHTERTIGEFALKLPPTVFNTTGIWMKVDEAYLDEIRSLGYSPDGSLHALEHSAIATLPLFALCDRMDLGGVSYPFNVELGSAAIFIHEAHEGGVGLARRGFECLRDWFGATLELMEECDCEVACPSCTQDPRCGNGNDPLDKRGAILILKKWLNG